MDTSVNKTVNSGPNGVLIIEVSLYVHTINVHTIYVRTCTYVRICTVCVYIIMFVYSYFKLHYFVASSFVKALSLCRNVYK